MRIPILTLAAVDSLGTPKDLGIPKVALDQGTLSFVIERLFTVVGALAAIFVIIGGLKYVLSQGDPKQIEEARNTILFAVIGVIISIIAIAIVRFVTTGVGEGIT